MTNLFQQFQSHWRKEFSPWISSRTRLLVTVSGGLDSVVLLDLLTRLGCEVVIAHCNFQLRGEESTRDEVFVRSLGVVYGKEVRVNHFNTKEYAAFNKISIQEAARDLRYEWFFSLVAGWQLTDNTITNYIVTAHHADDNIETLLMHFFRGTGLQGLGGILPLQKERGLLRPLLPFHKKELRAYAEERSLSFVEDSSNASDKYTRNFFRNQLIPQIQEVFPQVEENLLQNINRFREAGVLYAQSVQQHLDKLVVQKGAELHVPVLKWKKTVPLHTITWELIKPYGFSPVQTEEVIRLLDAENGAYIASPTHRIIHNRQWMIICSHATEHAAHIQVEATDKKILFENGTIEIHTIDQPGNTVSHTNEEVRVDSSDISFPLLLRRWKTGDYFYPLGMQKKKKLSRFFIDNKLSRTDKEKVWVLESDRKIIWVIGYRIDNRFRIGPQTRQALSLSYRK